MAGMSAGALRTDRALSVLAVISASAYVLLVTWCITHEAYDVWGGLLIAPVLVAVSLPFLLRLARRDDVLTPRLIVLALIAKLLSALVRYWQTYYLYGAADGDRYNDAGTRIAQAMHDGLPWAVQGPVPGTGVMEGITGYVYWVIGSTSVGGFIFFSWLGFWGLLTFQRAFAHAFPVADVRRYTLLIFFLPSLLFWPSSIGKESWMLFCLGMASYGAALLLRRRPAGFIPFAAGLIGAYYVRPHMAGLLLGAVTIGFLVRPLKPGGTFAPLVKVAAAAAVLAGSAYVLTNAASIFASNVPDAGSTVSDVLSATTERTDEGGSAFDATPVSSPLDLPQAAVAVLLRPFPYEARNIQSLVASLETLVVVWLGWRTRDRLKALPRLLRREPWLAVCCAYTTMFVIAFSGFANFGVLTRQRVQVYPFVLVLLCLPKLPVKAPRRPPRTARPVHRAPAPHVLEGAPS